LINLAVDFPGFRLKSRQVIQKVDSPFQLMIKIGECPGRFSAGKTDVLFRSGILIDEFPAFPVFIFLLTGRHIALKKTGDAVK
jgi:hypothetical protein